MTGVSLTGRRVLITGGSSGIGLACARELTARGAKVALLARGEDALRQAAASLDRATAPFWRRARTTDGRAMPRVLGAFRPQDVAKEVSRALGSPRTERTVGGLMATLTLVDAVVPNLTLHAIGAVARLGWRNRERRPVILADSLTEPLVEARQRIGLRTRPSILVTLRDLARIGR